MVSEVDKPANILNQIVGAPGLFAKCWVGFIDWLGASVTFERCAENLRTRLRLRGVALPIFDQLVTRDVEWPFDALRSAAADAVRNCFQRRVPIDSIDNGHLLRIR